MRLQKLLGVGAMVAFAVPAMAALPPNYQRIEEIKAILDHNDVNRALNDALINSVTYVSQDLYRVRTRQCSLDVRLKDIPRDSPGPRLFSIHVSKAICTKAK